MLNDILKAVREFLKAIPILAGLDDRLDAIDGDLQFIKQQLQLITGDPGDAESPVELTALVDRIESFTERLKAQAGRAGAIGQIHKGEP